MSSFCAQCITRPSTHVDDEGFSVCDECDYGEIRAYDSPRGYESHQGMGTEEMCAVMQRKLNALAPAGERLVRASRLEHARDNTPGYVVIRLPRRRNGKVRDVREAFERELSHEPWAPSVRHVVTTAQWHVFERPVTKTAPPSTNPLMWLERYRRSGR